MKQFFYIIILFLTLSSAIAQIPNDNDPKAKLILDDLSKITKAYKSITAEYTYTILNKDKKQVEKQDGKIQVKGNKFYLEIPGNTIVCDGKLIWNHNKDQQEVSIKCFDPTSEDIMDPTKIFTMYENGFKSKFVKNEKNNAGLMLQLIDLFPVIKTEKKKYHTAKLYIDKVKKQIIELKLIMKDGGVTSFQIRKFTPNLEISDKHFTFDLSKFSKDQIVNECE